MDTTSLPMRAMDRKCRRKSSMSGSSPVKSGSPIRSPQELRLTSSLKLWQNLRRVCLPPAPDLGRHLPGMAVAGRFRGRGRRPSGVGASGGSCPRARGRPSGPVESGSPRTSPRSRNGSRSRSRRASRWRCTDLSTRSRRDRDPHRGIVRRHQVRPGFGSRPGPQAGSPDAALHGSLRSADLIHGCRLTARPSRPNFNFGKESACLDLPRSASCRY